MTGPEVIGGGSSGQGNAGLHVLRADGAEEVEPARAAASLRGLAGPGVPLTWVHGDRRSELLDALGSFGIERHALRVLVRQDRRPRVDEYALHLAVSLSYLRVSAVMKRLKMVVYFRRQHWW
jgi:hypothetical protein